MKDLFWKTFFSTNRTETASWKFVIEKKFSKELFHKHRISLWLFIRLTFYILKYTEFVFEYRMSVGYCHNYFIFCKISSNHCFWACQNPSFNRVKSIATIKTCLIRLASFIRLFYIHVYFYSMLIIQIGIGRETVDWKVLVCCKWQ